MKRRILSIIAIILILLSISCDSSVKKLEEGNINYNIYPYLEFELSYDSTYYIAYVVEGAKVTTISIPGEKHTDYGAMPVKVFGGFRNPEDAVNLKDVYINVNVDKIADDAFEYAENLERIIITGAEEGSKWTKLPPSLKRKGYHFEGWRVGDTIYDGEGTVLIDTDNPVAVPYFVELEHYDAVSPTCTTQGSIEHWKCPECGKLFTDDRAENSVTSVSVAPLGHFMPLVWVDSVDATCQSNGNIGHYRCDRCHKTFSDAEGSNEIIDVTIPKLDHHEPGEVLFSNDYYHWYQCKWCQTEIDKSEHNWSDWVITISATLQTKGEKYHECTICNKRITVDIPEHDHIQGELLEEHEATCIEGAYYIEKCGNPLCGETVRFEIKSKPALGHAGSIVEFEDSTCEKEGVVRHFHCIRCNLNYANQSSVTPLNSIVVPKKDHEYSTIWSYDDNEHYHLCNKCGKAKFDVAHHVYDKEVTDSKYLVASSTCQHPNIYKKSCVCGKEGTEIFESGEMGEHKYTVAKSYDSEYHYYHCKYCGVMDPKSKGRHSFVPSTNGKKCELCGYEVPNVDGGFDFPILDATPLGHISVLSQEGTVWTFIFVNEKTSYPPKEFIWYVDGVEIERKSVEGISDYRMASFSVNAEYPMTYKVMCKYINDAGARSDTIVINGGVK